jgi:hypothetical protein
MRVAKKKLDVAEWGFRIDRIVGRPNSLIAEVTIWSANVAENGRRLVVVAERGGREL